MDKEPTSEVEDIDYDKILSPPRQEWDFCNSLENGRDYILRCSDCFYPLHEQVVDKFGLLKRFEEVFLAITNLSRKFNSEITTRMIGIESKLDLSQNVVRLGMLATPDFKNRSIIQSFLYNLAGANLKFPAVSLTIPDRGAIKAGADLLLEIQTTLTRLAGLTGSVARIARDWWYSSEDVIVVDGYYDPRKANKELISDLLQRVVDLVKKNQSIPVPLKESIARELEESIKDLAKTKAPWNKILSRIAQVVMLLGALVTVGANVDEAYKNMQFAINYISREALALSAISNAIEHTKEKLELTTTVSETDDNEKNIEKNLVLKN